MTDNLPTPADLTTQEAHRMQGLSLEGLTEIIRRAVPAERDLAFGCYALALVHTNETWREGYRSFDALLRSVGLSHSTGYRWVHLGEAIAAQVGESPTKKAVEGAKESAPKGILGGRSGSESSSGVVPRPEDVSAGQRAKRGKARDNSAPMEPPAVDASSRAAEPPAEPSPVPAPAPPPAPGPRPSDRGPKEEPPKARALADELASIPPMGWLAIPTERLQSLRSLVEGQLQQRGVSPDSYDQGAGGYGSPPRAAGQLDSDQERLIRGVAAWATSAGASFHDGVTRVLERLQQVSAARHRRPPASNGAAEPPDPTACPACGGTTHYAGGRDGKRKCNACGATSRDGKVQEGGKR